MRNGYGIQKWIDGSYYEGMWVNDKQSDGTMTFKDNVNFHF